MMRRIEAEERLAAITDGAVAGGNMRKLDAQRHQQRLQRAAHGAGRVKPARATPAALAGMGIAVVIETTETGSEKGLSDG